MSSGRASQVKRSGHLREQIFSNQFSKLSMQQINEQVNYTGSSADCFIDKEDALHILSNLKTVSGSTSLKGGDTYQFHLGRIPELIDYDSLETTKIVTESGKEQTHVSSSITEDAQRSALASFLFWKKYLGKGDLLCLDFADRWHFFNMTDVLNLLIDEDLISWRFLPTGRIKGDVIFSNGVKRVAITFEHRIEKNQSVLGAHGGKSGSKIFLPWLLDHIPHVIIPKMRT